MDNGLHIRFYVLHSSAVRGQKNECHAYHADDQRNKRDGDRRFRGVYQAETVGSEVISL